MVSNILLSSKIFMRDGVSMGNLSSRVTKSSYSTPSWPMVSNIL